MRVSLYDKDRQLLFNTLHHQGFSIEQIAKITQMSTRTVFDWRRGKYTMPKEHFEKIAALARIDLKNIRLNITEDWSHNSEAGKIGAYERAIRYGSLGTTEGRRLGGLISYNKRRAEKNGMFAKKTILKPAKSESLAEYIGILIGDGGLTQYQVVVSTNSIDDHDYSLFIAQLTYQLFGAKPTLLKRKNVNCVNIVTSSVELVNFLKLNGVLQGDKLKQNLNIPTWITEDRSYSIACIRGIFDTDGCIFQETHKINGKLYSYIRLSFVSMSSLLRDSIRNILSDLEFTPKIRNNRSVNLESLSDIKSYFEIIGTNNPKHLNRFKYFGGVG